MDMPEKCEKCRFNLNYPNAKQYCYIKQMVHDEDKPEWCPLKSVPNYKRTVGKETEGNTLLLNCGWNDCIDEIMKGGADE